MPSCSTVARICGVLTVALFFGACTKQPATAPQPEPGLTVTTTTLQEQELDQVLVASGSVGAWQDMALGVELSDLRVAKVLVEVGDRVRAGQVLLRLDARTLEVQARQADAGVAQARASLDLAAANLSRGERLVGEGLISSRDADELRARVTTAQAELTTAEADRDAARLRLEFATLRAPDDGVISARSVQPGQVVSSGAELLRLIRRGRLEWRAELAEADLSRVRAGAVVEVSGPRGERVSGRVRAVSPAVDPLTRVGMLYADLPQPGTLRAGMFAEGRILLGRVKAAVLPREAIVYRDGIPYVFVARVSSASDGGTFSVEQRRIGVGLQEGSLSEVREGIAAGERVVVRGAGFLSDGDLVRETAAGGGADS